MTWLSLLLSCTQGSPATGAGGTTGGTTGGATGGSGGGGDTGTAYTDHDGDGHSSKTDCDDWNENIHPDAEEIWNGVDDDCDGYRDADGTHIGSVAVEATAIYEGVPHDFSLICPATGSRGGGALSFTISCSPDKGDDWAMLLLGSSLTIRPQDITVSQDAWSGRVSIVSSNGWDTFGNGAAQWPDHDSYSLSVALSTVSLSLDALGTMTRTGP